VSVLLCAVVHFAVGGVYVGQARTLIRRKGLRRDAVIRGSFTTLAWVAGLLQFGCVVAGLLMILLP
jgi:hypothetical protein